MMMMMIIIFSLSCSGGRSSLSWSWAKFWGPSQVAVNGVFRRLTPTSWPQKKQQQQQAIMSSANRGDRTTSGCWRHSRPIFVPPIGTQLNFLSHCWCHPGDKAANLSKQTTTTTAANKQWLYIDWSADSYGATNTGDRRGGSSSSRIRQSWQIIGAARLTTIRVSCVVHMDISNHCWLMIPRTSQI